MQEMDQEVLTWIRGLESNVSRALLGKEDAVRLAVVALMMKGHILLEDVPGVGKTLIAKAIAASVGASFGRIQFTADLLPADVTGSSIYDSTLQQFAFKPGPIFVNVLLADELNRASPRTQSSLLEAMNESQVTVDGKTHVLPTPFWVIATQNPIEHEGTYPLPASQLDRFALSLRIGYPSVEWETEILRQHRGVQSASIEVPPVIGIKELCRIHEAVEQVHVDPSISDYVARLVAKTRATSRLRMGASPRGAILLHRAAMAMALAAGRPYCVPDDVKQMAVPVLAHRVLMAPEVQAQGSGPEAAIQALLDEVPVPM